MPNAQAYAALAKMVVPALRIADPSAVIIGPALKNVYSGARLFAAALARDGALPLFDAVSVHPYRLTTPESLGQDYAPFRQLLQGAGSTAPLVDSEMGYSTFYPQGTTWGSGPSAPLPVPPRVAADTQRNLTSMEQAAALVRTYLYNLSQGVPISIWYDWQDDCAAPAVSRCHYGVLDWQGQPKSLYSAAGALASTLGGYHFTRCIPQKAGDTLVLAFARGDTTAYALWTTLSGRTRTVTLPLSGMWALRNISGTRTQTLNATGHITLQATGMPQYLVPLSSSSGNSGI
jgi:hypothetical protein